MKLKGFLIALLLILVSSATSLAYQGEPAAVPDDSYTIQLQNRQFVPDPTESIALTEKVGGERQHVILQFNTLPEVEELAKWDIIPLNYVPDNAILASVPNGFEWQSVPEARWLGQLTAADKLSTAVQEQLISADQVTVVVEAFSDVSGETVAALIRAAEGTVDTHPDLPEYIQLATLSAAGLAQLTEAEEIAWLMPANERLLNKEPVYYCAGAETPYGPIPNYVIARQGWDGTGLGSAHLTYHFVNGTPDIAGTAEEIAVEQALAEWAHHADLTFTETDTAGLNRSLDISWAAGDHGDGNPFDGPGNVLAHAFFPPWPPSDPLAGDMHFDEAENWSLTNDFHMYTVALHEAGHALGLGHSNVAGAVMEAFYGGPVNGLHADDIAGIQSIYGAVDDTICTGQTTPGSTSWVDYYSTGIYVYVDTSACGFTSTPLYHTTIGGDGYHWEVRGASSIYNPTPTGFRVFIEYGPGINPTKANGTNFKWHINWSATPKNINNSRLCTGQTTPGSTNWVVYSPNDIYVDVNTTACAATSTPYTPQYITSIGGSSSHWLTKGASSIYPTATGFRIYINYDKSGGITPAQANTWNWHINWTAVPTNTITDDYCSGRTTPGSTNWIDYVNNGIYTDLDISPCGFEHQSLNMTSLGGSSHHWITKGATSIYNPTATGFRTYIHNPSTITAAQANTRNWHMNWIAYETAAMPPLVVDDLQCTGGAGVLLCSATASGGNGNGTYSFTWQVLSNGSLPSNGGTGTSSGVIGTCANNQNGSVRVTVTDSTGATANRQTSFQCPMLIP